jgi:hypothetical protein
MVMMMMRNASNVMMMMMRDASNVMVVGMMGMTERLGVFVVCARHTCAEHHRSGG